MISSIQRMSRPLSPFEHLILKCVCTGQSNLAISETTHFPVKTIENAISRSAKVFGVCSTPQTNLRVLLALAYGANFKSPEYDSGEMVRTHLASLPA
jgi:DNA-binding NarL/FixJ family response regulator